MPSVWVPKYCGSVFLYWRFDMDLPAEYTKTPTSFINIFPLKIKGLLPVGAGIPFTVKLLFIAT